MTPGGSIARDILFFLQFLSLDQLVQQGEQEWRGALVSRIAGACSDDAKYVQTLNTADLAGAVLAQSILVRGGIATRAELQDWSLDTQRNALITQNQHHTGLPTKIFQMDSTLNNSMRAYSTWIYQVESLQLIKGLSDIAAANLFSFSTMAILPDHGSKKVGLDCISIIETYGTDKFLGVFHSADESQKDIFNVFVATSTNLKDWKVERMILKRASMAKIYSGPKFPFDGVLILYETNVESSEPSISGPAVAGAWFASEQDLLQGNIGYQFASHRSISEFAEGTPNLISSSILDENSSDRSPLNCVLNIGMHYLHRRSSGEMVDQQGYALLTGFDGKNGWLAFPATLSNEFLLKQGYLGKIGARSTFRFGSRTFFIVEAQKELDNWASWTLLLGDGIGFTEIPMHSPQLSTSFANPWISQLGNYTSTSYIASAFVPSEGTWGKREEAGELLYKFQIGGCANERKTC